MLLRTIRATLLASIPLGSLLLALLAMGGPPCGVSLVHALGEFLGRDALHSIDFLEDGSLVLAGHVLEALQCDVPILGEVDTAGAAGRPWLPMRHAGLEVGSEHVTPTSILCPSCSMKVPLASFTDQNESPVSLFACSVTCQSYTLIQGEFS